MENQVKIASKKAFSNKLKIKNMKELLSVQKDNQIGSLNLDFYNLL